MAENLQNDDCVPIQELADLKLILAADEGNVEKITAMIDNGARINSWDELFGSPLVASVNSGNTAATELLLDKGAAVDSKDTAGCTALIVATLVDHVDMVRLLLFRHADVNASCYPLVHGKRVSRFTPLIVAKAKKNDATVKLLLDAGAKD